MQGLRDEPGRKSRNTTTSSSSKLIRRNTGSVLASRSVSTLWPSHAVPIVRKLITYATKDGQA